ncbi:MAG: NHL repeat-containing protein [Chloroflexota bacterium]
MRLTVDHVDFAHGARRGGTGGFGVSEQGSILHRWGSQRPLFSLCALEGAAAEETSPIITDALHAEFARNTGRSLTSSLTRAVRTAQDALDRENARSLAQHRCAGAVCAAALKEETLYIACSGGGLACAWHAGEARILCVSEAGPPGNLSDQDFEVNLASWRLEPGDVVILASRGLAQLGDETTLGTALAGHGGEKTAEALESLYLSTSQRHDFAAVVLSAPPAEAQPTPARRVEQREESQAPEPRPIRAEPPPSYAPPPARPPQVRERQSRRPEPEAEPEALARDGNSWLSGLGSALSNLKPSLVRVLLRFSAVALMLAAVSVVLYLGQNFLESRAQQAQAEQLLSTLQQKERDAAAETDPAKRRWLLIEAGRAADQALSAPNPSDTVVEISKRVRTSLDELNGVTRLSNLNLLADLSALDKSSQPAQLLATKDNLYVVDRGTGSAWYLKMGTDLGALGQPKPLWRKGDTVGGTTMGEAMAIFWMHVAAPGIPEQVYVLDSGGSLVRCVNGVAGQPLRLPAAGALSKVKAAAGQAGNLYVLDTQRRLVWRYTPGANGYDGAGQEYLTEAAAPDIASAVDMAMDGNLYLLLADGRIGKYASGKAQTFPAVVPDAPLRNPTALFTSPTTRYVYVADSGNARVVRFTKDGQYAGQYRAQNDALSGLRSVFVDEGSGRLYAIVNSRVFVAQLPAEPKPQ